MARRSIGYYDYNIGAIEKGSMNRSPDIAIFIDLPAPPISSSGAILPHYELSPNVARKLSRQLKKWADVSDPPKRTRK